MHRYKVLGRKGEGTFSEVLLASELSSGKQFAIKCMKRRFTSSTEVNNLPEIRALRQLGNHPNIVSLTDVLFEDGRLAVVLELMDMNLYEVIKDRRNYLAEDKVRSWMFQLGTALEYVHRSGYIHRDVKPENVLLHGESLKLADLGSCCVASEGKQRSYDKPGTTAKPGHTEYISTRWYRSPECLLTSGFYSFPLDLWALGCVWFEVLSLVPLFPGKDEMDQVNRIHSVLGTPDEGVLRGFRANASGSLKDLRFPHTMGSGIESKTTSNFASSVVGVIKLLLNYEPSKRITAPELIKHPYFSGMHVPTLKMGLPSPSLHIVEPQLLAPVLLQPRKISHTMNTSPQHRSVTEIDHIIAKAIRPPSAKRNNRNNPEFDPLVVRGKPCAKIES